MMTNFWFIGNDVFMTGKTQALSEFQRFIVSISMFLSRVKYCNEQPGDNTDFKC